MKEKANSSYDLSSLIPRCVIDSQGNREDFAIIDIVKKLNIQTGLSEELSQEVADQVVIKLMIESKHEVKKSHIKDLVCAELALRGLDKEKSLYGAEHHNFYLDDAFLEKYKERQPRWGPIGYITYKRTYSRVKPDGEKEEFWETLRRVVEGVYSAQKTHCIAMMLPWNEKKARRSAQRMYEKAWNFKFLPPGRGLWIMGTDFVRRHGSMALNNCFSYETEVITKEGIKKIGDCAGTQQTLLSKGGKWVDAPIKSFGTQKLVKLTLKRNGTSKEIYCTPDHRWFAESRKRPYRGKDFLEFKTTDLPINAKLSYVCGQGVNGVVRPSPCGIAHGICYGDGTTAEYDNWLYLCGDKKELEKYFPLNEKNVDNNVSSDGAIRVADLPRYFRDLPPLEETRSYLYGWLTGYFAADGSCKADGTCVISSSKREDIEFVRDLCVRLGIGYSIRKETRDKELDGKIYKNHTMYFLTLMPNTLSKDFFLRSQHRKNFTKRKRKERWKVVSVERTDRKEEVYCATVPDTHSFALEGNILTGNCGFISTQNIDLKPTMPFEFLMDALMLGVGVGFDTKGKEKIVVKKPADGTYTFKVPDNREGWVKGLKLLLNAYFKGDQVPEYDYSQIRPKGSPIKGFGGVASGPDPLDNMYASIEELLNDRIGELLRSTDIVDMMNFIGKCVVAGNVRRCLEEDMKVHSKRGIVPIKSLRVGDLVLTSDGSYRKVTKIFDQGVQDTVKINTSHGSIECTPNHRVAVYDGLKSFGWKHAGELTENDRLISTCHSGGMNGISEDEMRLIGKDANFDTLIERDLVNPDWIPIEIESVEPNGKKHTYDIEVEGNHNFVCEGFLVHNSAEIALGDPTDSDYIEMKNFEKYAFECDDRRWASNNSVIVDPHSGFDYTEIAEKIKMNGEPGVLWLENARAYSRMNGNPDWKDRKVMGVNPCFSGDTLIAVADGRGAVTIKQLAEEEKDIPVYSLDEDGKVVIKMGRHPRITGHDKKLLKITFENGDTLSVTPDHEMLLLNGKVVKANSLKKGDSLPRFIKRVEGIRDKDHLRVYRDTRNARKDKIYEHRMIAEFFQPEKWNELYEDGVTNGFVKTNNIVEHHNDENAPNNNPNNLEIMTFSEHSDLHGFYDVEGENNPMHGKTRSEETKLLIGQRTRERCKDEKCAEKSCSAIGNGMDNSEVKQKLSEARKNELKKYYLQFERETDLDAVWIDDQLFVKKCCESCEEEMILPVGKREQGFCSISCANKKEESIQSRKEGQKEYFEERQRDVLHQQINTYKDLIQKLERTPLKKEWETECKKRGVSHRCNSRSDHQHVLKNYGDLKSRAKTYNHRILKIETLSSKENVYNITVDDHHTVGVVTQFDSDTMACDGIFTKQCGEQSLESSELCCLVETFPSRHESFDEYRETLKYAYLYAKSVTLMKTHWKETNGVMLKNRRIGTSMSGIVEAIHHLGRRRFLRWCEKGYAYLKELDQIYSDWLTVPKSVKITTVKPSGCSVKETLVNTSKGIFTLEELGDIDGDRWQDKSNIETTSQKNITRFYVNGNADTKVIETEDGNVLESSLLHRYRIYDGDLKKFTTDNIKWKKVDELQEGDLLICVLDDYKKDVEPNMKLIPIPTPRSVEIKQPQKMSPKLAWFVGLVYAEGYMDIYRGRIKITFNGKHPSLVHGIGNVVRDLFGIESVVSDNEISINSKHLIEYLNHNGIIKGTSQEIEVPFIIRQGSRESILSFINGFWRGDGSIHHISSLSICTTSKKFALQLLTLARSVGINTKIKNAGIGGWGIEDRWIMTARFLNPEKMRHAPKKLRNRLHDNGNIVYWIDPITNIKISKNHTYDISVPDGNEYISNGVISHNSVSLLPGVSAGIHYPHSEYYIRRIRIAKESKLIPLLKDAGYRMEEVATGEKTMMVVEFPIHEKDFVRGKRDASMWEQLLNASDMQKYWSDNQVSITVSFNKAEADKIRHALESFEDRLKSVSFVPLSDHGYEQAPYEEITEKQYEKRIAELKPLKLDGFKEQSVGVLGCDGDSCQFK